MREKILSNNLKSKILSSVGLPQRTVGKRWSFLQTTNSEQDIDIMPATMLSCLRAVTKNAR